jgi:hypothetical protein
VVLLIPALSREVIMIDISSETILPLSQAAKRLPSYRRGRPVTLSCLLRWVFNGVKRPDGVRVRLEALRLGRWVTSLEALQRFAEAQTPTCEDDRRPQSRTPTARARAAQRAERKLERAGI